MIYTIKRAQCDLMRSDPEVKKVVNDAHNLDCWLFSNFETHKLKRSTMCWVAYHHEEPERPVAFLILDRSGWWEPIWYIARVGVAPKHRGHRLQQQLIICAQHDMITQYGIAQSLYAAMRYTNDVSINNFIACGFKAKRPHRRWAGTKNLIYMGWDPRSGVRYAACDVRGSRAAAR